MTKDEKAGVDDACAFVPTLPHVDATIRQCDVCECGHQWQAHWHNRREGFDCRHCGCLAFVRRSATVEQLRRIVLSRMHPQPQSVYSNESFVDALIAAARLGTAAPALLDACQRTIADHPELADGDDCTLRHLKRAIANADGRRSEAP